MYFIYLWCPIHYFLIETFVQFCDMFVVHLTAVASSIFPLGMLWGCVILGYIDVWLAS